MKDVAKLKSSKPIAKNATTKISSDFLRQFQLNQKKCVILGIIAILALFIIYKNHFDNPFELDDSHTIANNAAIRDLNIPLFFRDATTFSTLPANQAYRPGLTTLNAIDYKLWSDNPGENPLPKWFHVSTFLTYCILCVSLFFFYSYFFRYAFPTNEWTPYFSLFASAFFAFHTANAETVNYIIQRAEIYSTLAVILAFLLFIYFKDRELHLFLIPIVFGFFIKEPVVMFAPLAFAFVFLFEENASLKISAIFSNKLRKPFFYSIAALVIGILLFINAKQHTPKTWTSGSENISAFWYLITNFYSVMHYVFNFILPLNLSVDTDVSIVNSLFDIKIIGGFALIVTMLYGAYKFSLQKETRPAAFGILWFFITLIPTSTIFPFAEPLNDHRPFFGYIGLVLTVVNLFAVVVIRRNEFEFTKKLSLTTLAILPCLLIVAHGLGAYNRNNVWGSEETLWKDASEKCPKSGRIWMNYGLTLMRRGEYNGALNAFTKAKEFSPYYSYLYINFGILKNAMGKTAEAETDFLTGIQYGPNSPDGFKFYADYLLRNKRLKQADSICNIGLRLSPQNAGLLELKGRIQNYTPPEEITVGLMEQKVKASPSRENWINLSLARYNSGDYRGCITAAEEALKLDPQYVPAYNNICAAYNMLGEWKKAAEAGKKGLEFEPENQLLRNNLNESLSHLN
jgi:protein O-mannosyl-transferase